MAITPPPPYTNTIRNEIKMWEHQTINENFRKISDSIAISGLVKFQIIKMVNVECQRLVFQNQ